MKKNNDEEFMDYYNAYCELAVWFRKIVIHANKKAAINIQDIEDELVTERNRILTFAPQKRRADLEQKLNKITREYYEKISKWSASQRTTTDMV